MRVVLAALLFAGCAFTPSSNTPASGDQPDAASVDIDGGPIAAKCHVADPDLRLCLDFEGPLAPTAVDLSGGSHDATVTGNVIPGTRFGLGGLQQAAIVNPQASIKVPKSPMLDLSQAVTVEMWISPTSAPDSATFPLTNSQYSVGWEKGAATCQIGNTSISDPNKVVTTFLWSHVACTYDGSRLALFVNGNVVACTNANKPPMTNSGTSIGSNGYQGGVDDVHAYARALAPAEVCARAGVTSCTAQCPQQSEGPSRPHF